MSLLTHRLAWLGSANFVTATGGAAVLGSAIHSIRLPFIEVGSLVAFFFGTALGLGFLFTIFQTSTRRTDTWVAFLGAGCTLALLGILTAFAARGTVLSGGAGLAFFALLCLRFAFWFLSRVLRSDRMARESPRAVPLLEGCFHTGTIVSLLCIGTGAWKLSLAQILLLDLATQCGGGIIDRLTHATTAAPRNTRDKHELSHSTPPDRSAYAQLTAQLAVFTLLTILVQVTLFHIAHSAPPTIASGILAAFYLGMAIAGLVGGRYGLRAVTDGRWGRLQLGALPAWNLSNGTLLVISVATTIGVVLHVKHGTAWSVGGLTCIASLAYEALALGLVDLMGHTAARTHTPRIVAKAYSLMALAACVSMTLFRWWEANTLTTAITTMSLATICAFLLRAK